MKLELDEFDLRQDCQDILPGEVRFYHFSERAQAAIQLIGRAVFIKRGSKVDILPHYKETKKCKSSTNLT